MSKDVTLQLDSFGAQALERFARGAGEPETRALRTASLYYLADREAERPAWKAPRFAPQPSGTRVSIALDDATWHALQEEAGRQGVSIDDLALHALMYFLADLDRGRVASRLDDTLAGG